MTSNSETLEILYFCEFFHQKFQIAFLFIYLADYEMVSLGTLIGLKIKCYNVLTEFRIVSLVTMIELNLLRCVLASLLLSLFTRKHAFLIQNGKGY